MRARTAVRANYGMGVHSAKSEKIPCHTRPVPSLSCIVRIFFWFLVFAFLACEGAHAQWNVVMHAGRRYVSIEDVAAFYRMGTPVSDAKIFAFSGQGRTVRGQAGGRDIYINNVKYVLCFAIVSEGGRHLISAMDVTKIIEPVMRPGKIKNAAEVRTVVLDAGHGGHDSGATGSLCVEKIMALDVVQRAKRMLQESGYTVRLTRNDDTFIPLEQRSAFANKFLNAIFISVHFNKSNTSGGTGIETFALAPRGVPSMDEENLSYSDFKQHPGHARDPENTALATAMHSSMLRHLRMYDRGIKRARFAVIRNLTIPGVLLEGGFVNNPTDSRQIASLAFREAFARAIAEGVGRYRNSVVGQMQSFVPTAVVSATDPTSAPIIKKEEETPSSPKKVEITPVGEKTPLEPSVSHATDSLLTPSSTSQPSSP